MGFGFRKSIFVLFGFAVITELSHISLSAFPKAASSLSHIFAMALHSVSLLQDSDWRDLNVEDGVLTG